MKFQQYTGPLQAKGLEDTAFYRYNLLLSLNEVGGDPSRFGVGAAEFHELNQQRRQEWPYEMLATATHDTKLGEDVRRASTCSRSCPRSGAAKSSRWMRLARPARTIVDGEPAPDRNDDTASTRRCSAPGRRATKASPTRFVERLQAYMIKSIKEAKLHSSWINPDEAYETGGARPTSSAC